MRKFTINAAVTNSKDPSSVRFPHPFVYHFERNSSLGITTGTKYFRGHRDQNKEGLICNIVAVDTEINKIE